MFVCAHWGAVGEFAASRYGVITRKQAAAIGLTPKVVTRRVKAGYLREPTPGVLTVAGSEESWHQRMLVATLASGGIGVAGFRSAAALHRLDGYSHGPVELLLPTARRNAALIATVHRASFSPDDVATVDGIRCTNIARTLIDIASVDRPERVAQAFESAWRNGVSLAWLRHTAESLQGHGQRGARLIIQLLDGADAHRRPSESVLELRLERILKDVPGLVRQHSVVTNGGSFVARVDFAIPGARIAVEAHSRRFHFGPGAVAADEAREHALKSAGWDVYYFGQQSMKAPARVRAAVVAAISRRANLESLVPIAGTTDSKLAS
jgi:very-short-patch-repair endonuclease